MIIVSEPDGYIIEDIEDSDRVRVRAVVDTLCVVRRSDRRLVMGVKRIDTVTMQGEVVKGIYDSNNVRSESEPVQVDLSDCVLVCYTGTCADAQPYVVDADLNDAKDDTFIKLIRADKEAFDKFGPQFTTATTEEA